jgi:hypothetical protein
MPFLGLAMAIASAGAGLRWRARGVDEGWGLGQFRRACVAETLLLAELGCRER